jgi:hypothetical protein
VKLFISNVKLLKKSVLGSAKIPRGWEVYLRGGENLKLRFNSSSVKVITE